MHEHVETARTGASAMAKGSSANPRDLVVRLIEQHKNAGKEELFDLFRAELSHDQEYQRAVEWYFFVNMYEYAVTSRGRAKTPEQRQAAQQRQRQVIDIIKAQILLLDMDMPNGKPMKDCTGADMAKFGNRYVKIGQRVGARQLVGAVLSEDQVKALMK